MNELGRALVNGDYEERVEDPVTFRIPPLTSPTICIAVGELRGTVHNAVPDTGGLIVFFMFRSVACDSDAAI